MRNFNEFVNSKKNQYGQKFDQSDLSSKFITYYENGMRIKVNSYGEIITGTVGVTTGWKPVFLLMRTSRSIGSAYTLKDSDQIISEKHGKKYITACLAGKRITV